MLHVFIIRIGIMYKQRIAQLTFQYKNVFHYQHFMMCTRFDLLNVVFVRN